MINFINKNPGQKSLKCPFAIKRRIIGWTKEPNCFDSLYLNQVHKVSRKMLTYARPL